MEPLHPTCRDVDANLHETAADRVGSSTIRDLLRLAERPDVLSLAGGLPDVGLIDAERFRAAIHAAASAEGPNGPIGLQYGPTAGLLELRSVIGRRLDVPADDVVITTGSQQGLDLVARAVCAPGDLVVVQRPAYVGAVQAFRSAGATVRSVAGDDEGLDVAALAALIDDGAMPAVLYVVADHHNPTGTVMSPGRRATLRALGRRHGFLIVEDAAYRDVHWGPPTTTVFCPGERTVHLGSSSKVLAPGLRIGWMTGPADVLERVTRLKQAADLHTPTWNQLVVAHLLSDAQHEAHLDRLRSVYRERSLALHGALLHHLGERVQMSVPDGGMFLWLRSTDGTDPQSVLDRALGGVDTGSLREVDPRSAGAVAFVPGAAFTVPGEPVAVDDADHPDRTARLCFASHPPDRLAEAAERLSRAWTEPA